MTDGSVPSAENPLDSSTSTPTDSQPTGPDETFPVTSESLSAALEDMFRQGWRAARLLPAKVEPLGLRVTVTLNRETSQVEIDAQLL